MNNRPFDIHLSAKSIADATREILEASGFIQDFFRNNRNSEPPHYHASLKMHLGTPDNVLWNNTKAILLGDPEFCGCLEEEEFQLQEKIETCGIDESACGDIPAFALDTCKPGEHKACDIHININLEESAPSALMKMERFNFISFEREVGGTMRRIYSLTFEDLELGGQVFRKLYNMLVYVPHLVGKMKLEKVTRFLVYPNTADQLPIVRNQTARKWLAM